MKRLSKVSRPKLLRKKLTKRKRGGSKMIGGVPIKFLQYVCRTKDGPTHATFANDGDINAAANAFSGGKLKRKSKKKIVKRKTTKKLAKRKTTKKRKGTKLRKMYGGATKDAKKVFGNGTTIVGFTPHSGKAYCYGFTATTDDNDGAHFNRVTGISSFRDGVNKKGKIDFTSADGPFGETVATTYTGGAHRREYSKSSLSMFRKMNSLLGKMAKLRHRGGKSLLQGGKRSAKRRRS
jgi:hypothetical protein